MQDDTLYFVVRKDLCEGRRAAQLIHAMGAWTAFFDQPDGNGTVIVYEVPDHGAIEALKDKIHSLKGEMALWEEPDLDWELTAFATTMGPWDLPLLGSRKRKRRVSKYRLQAA